MTDDHSLELMFAKCIALQTWQLISNFYDLPLRAERKADGSPVTLADKAANQFIIENLRKAFPLDSIVSEEAESILNGERTWYIDPIDGTKGFIKRNGHFAIHIGFCERDSPTLGVVYCPIGGDLYYRVKGKGAWRKNSRGIVELKAEKSTRKELIASTNGDNPYNDLKPIFEELGVKIFHNCGSDGLRLMKLAENRADIRISEYIGTNTWDLCAPQAIAEASGIELRYINGKKIVYNRQRMLEQRYMACADLSLLNKAKEISKELLV